MNKPFKSIHEKDNGSIIYEAYRNLLNAVVIQAVEDYKKALKYNNINEQKRLEDSFFYSDTFSGFTKVNGHWLIQQVRKDFFSQK